MHVKLFHFEELKRVIKEDFNAELDEARHPLLGSHPVFSRSTHNDFTIGHFVDLPVQLYFKGTKGMSERGAYLAAKKRVVEQFKQTVGDVHIINPERFHPPSTSYYYVFTNKGVVVNPHFRPGSIKQKSTSLSPRQKSALEELIKRQPK